MLRSAGEVERQVVIGSCSSPISSIKAWCTHEVCRESGRSSANKVATVEVIDTALYSRYRDVGSSTVTGSCDQCPQSSTPLPCPSQMQTPGTSLRQKDHPIQSQSPPMFSPDAPMLQCPCSVCKHLGKHVQVQFVFSNAPDFLLDSAHSSSAPPLILANRIVTIPLRTF